VGRSTKYVAREKQEQKPVLGEMTLITVEDAKVIQGAGGVEYLWPLTGVSGGAPRAFREMGQGGKAI